MARFFTSDQHFFHEKVILYSKRPFANLDEMHTSMIERWNATVGVGDDVYVIGDFIFDCRRADHARVRHLLDHLNGRIHIIPGDHDKVDWIVSNHPRVRFHMPIHEISPVQGRVEPIVLCHHPMRKWAKSHYGAWHLFGHVHGDLDTYGKSFNVGCDMHHYTPLSDKDIENIMETCDQNSNFIKPEDRHKG